MGSHLEFVRRRSQSAERGIDTFPGCFRFRSSRVRHVIRKGFRGRCHLPLLLPRGSWGLPEGRGFPQVPCEVEGTRGARVSLPPAPGPSSPRAPVPPAEPRCGGAGRGVRKLAHLRDGRGGPQSCWCFRGRSSDTSLVLTGLPATPRCRFVGLGWERRRRVSPVLQFRRSPTEKSLEGGVTGPTSREGWQSLERSLGPPIPGLCPEVLHPPPPAPSLCSPTSHLLQPGSQAAVQPPLPTPGSITMCLSSPGTARGLQRQGTRGTVFGAG